MIEFLMIKLAIFHDFFNFSHDFIINQNARLI